MSRPCAVCESTASDLKLSVRGHAILRCARCGFEWVDPPPTAAELAAFYDDESYYDGCDAGYAHYEADEAGHRRLARRRLDRLQRAAARGRLVDLGCGPGFFVEEAIRRGWSATGVEISAPMRARCAGRGLPVLPGEDATPAALGQVDVVTMWEYIEHVRDPAGELRRVAALLRPGGLLALSTPNVAHRLARSAPLRWPEYKPPAHLSFFDARTLARLLERTGFAVLEVRHTVPAFGLDGLSTRLVEGLGRACGTGRDRRTRWWWLYSAAYRVQALPARAAALVRPAPFSLGLEVTARRA